MGAALSRQPDQLRGCHRRLRAGDQPLPSPTGAATADRHRRHANTDPAGRLHGRGGGRSSRSRVAAAVGRNVLYWWPDDGWQRGTVARLCPRGAFPHVVAYRDGYTRQTSALRGTAGTLLDAAFYSFRWVLHSPAPAAGMTRALRPRAPDLKFEFSRWLVTTPSPGPGGQRHKNVLRMPASAALPVVAEDSSFAVHICCLSHEQSKRTFRIASCGHCPRSSRRCSGML